MRAGWRLTVLPRRRRLVLRQRRITCAECGVSQSLWHNLLTPWPWFTFLGAGEVRDVCDGCMATRRIRLPRRRSVPVRRAPVVKGGL